MYSFPSGVWTDYSRPVGFQGTITLQKSQGNIFLSFLTVLVTVAAANLWNVVALLLHSYLVRSRSRSDVFDIQQQVSLRNAKSPVGTALDLLKLSRAWSKKQTPRLVARTAVVVIPTLLLWAGTTVASIFASRVATSKNTGTVAPVGNQGCGIIVLQTTESSLEQQSAHYNKVINDTIAARNYANNFYSNSTSDPSVRSSFVTNSLPFTVNTEAPCPFSNHSRCSQERPPIQFDSGLLDSHEMLGINAQTSDRVTFKTSSSCAMFDQSGLFTRNGSYSWLYNMGGIEGGSSYTYSYPLSRWEDDIGYQVISYSAPSPGTSANEGSWIPISDFNRTDADMSIILLTQNHVRYNTPVEDPFFEAITRDETTGYYIPTYYVQAMICTDQFMFCNPSNNKCSTPAGYTEFFTTAVSGGGLGLNYAQRATAARVATQMQQTSIAMSVRTMNSAALFASNHVLGNSWSSGLPKNQWHLEVAGWFETKLAKIQASVVEYINKPPEQSSLSVISPDKNSSSLIKNYGFTNEMIDTLKSQCNGQLVMSSGEIQNFSLAGVVIIICLSGFFLVVNLFMSKIMGLFGRFVKGSSAMDARQADDKLHLLRLALASADPSLMKSWELGSFDIPITSQNEGLKRPEKDVHLAYYPV